MKHKYRAIWPDIPGHLSEQAPISGMYNFAFLLRYSARIAETGNMTQPNTALMFSRFVPARMRQEFTRLDELYCQMCGTSAGDTDEYSGQRARFLADLVPNNGLSFRSRYPQIRVLCSTCDQGVRHITTEKPSGVWLLSQIRRAGQAEQKAVYEWLSKKFAK